MFDPAQKKEDIVFFGNGGRIVGAYIHIRTMAILQMTVGGLT